MRKAALSEGPVQGNRSLTHVLRSPPSYFLGLLIATAGLNVTRGLATAQGQEADIAVLAIGPHFPGYGNHIFLVHQQDRLPPFRNRLRTIIDPRRNIPRQGPSSDDVCAVVNSCSPKEHDTMQGREERNPFRR